MTYRPPYTWASAISLVLGGCAMYLWVQSATPWSHEFRVKSSPRIFAMRSYDGTLYLCAGDGQTIAPTDADRFLGFVTSRDAGHASGISRWAWGVPYWFFAALAALMPLRWALVFDPSARRSRFATATFGWRDRLRINLGKRWLRNAPPGARPCRRCGYDIRATPQRCPECGLETSAPVVVPPPPPARVAARTRPMRPDAL